MTYLLTRFDCNNGLIGRSFKEAFKGIHSNTLTQTLLFKTTVTFNLGYKLAFIRSSLIRSLKTMTSYSVSNVSTQPFEGQKPGTSGLRKPVQTFMQEHYSENFIQCILNAANEKTKLVVGGDGRYHNKHVVQTIIGMCAANQVIII